MNTNEGLALFSRIQENLADLAPQLVFSDWLEEQERLNEALLWRKQKPNSDLYELYKHGFGNGTNDEYSFSDVFNNDVGSGYGYGYAFSTIYRNCYGSSDRHGRGDGYIFNHGVGSGYCGNGFIDTNDKAAWLKQHEKLTATKD